MGKYDKVMDGLPPLPVEDQKYQDAVNEVKRRLLHPASQSLLEFSVLTEDLLTDAQEIIQRETEATKTEAKTTFTPEALVQSYKLARKAKEDVEAVLAEVQKRLTALEQLLVKSFEEDETGWGEFGATPNTLRLRNGSAVRLEPGPRPKVEDRAAFQAWCLKNGYKNDLVMNAKRMEAITKELMLDAKPAPAGVKVYSGWKVVNVK
jgi:hypothetical protein